MKRLILILLTGAAFAASSPAYAAVKTVVLVHGAFADGSGWKPVADILLSHGYAVDLAAKIPAAAKSIGPVADGFLAVNPDAFASDFAADAPKPVARFMAISQVPASVEAFNAKATVAAWKQKPSYAVIPKKDRMINPDLERFMTKRAQSQVIKLPGSHAIFLSHALEVAALIEKAATAAQ